MQLDFYYQFQVSIIAKKIFLLKLYLFKVQINALFCCFNKLEKKFFKLWRFYFENLLNILFILLVILIYFTVQNHPFYWAQSTCKLIFKILIILSKILSIQYCLFFTVEHSTWNQFYPPHPHPLKIRNWVRYYTILLKFKSRIRKLLPLQFFLIVLNLY